MPSPDLDIQEVNTGPEQVRHQITWAHSSFSQRPGLMPPEMPRPSLQGTSRGLCRQPGQETGPGVGSVDQLLLLSLVPPHPTCPPPPDESESPEGGAKESSF